MHFIQGENEIRKLKRELENKEEEKEEAKNELKKERHEKNKERVTNIGLRTKVGVSKNTKFLVL